MIRENKKFSFIIPSILLVLSAILCLSFMPTAKAETPTYETKTLTEISSPVIAGVEGSYIDDGVLYYAGTGDTIGYNLDHSNIMFEFDFVPTAFAWPGWLSWTLKASYLDRTQSAGLEQKGYSFAVFPAGSIEVWKNGTTVATGSKVFSVNTKYNIKLGAINEGDNVRLILKVNDVEIINVVDSTAAYTTGNWFNLCGDGGGSAEYHTTKKIVIPKYYTYTPATIANYPTIAGEGTLATADKYNNISIYSSGATVGFYQYLQNCSFEMNVNFSEFKWPANFYFSMRTGGFDRVMSAGLTRKGYSFRISPTGSMEIYKEGISIAAGSCGGIAENTDYVIEFGAVDINRNSTYVFFAVNNKVCASVFDNENPIQEYGWVNMNGDGIIACEISSSDTKVSPLRSTKEDKGDFYEIKTYFVNPISYENMTTRDFSDRNLKAISIGGKNLLEIKTNYYAKEGPEDISPFEIKFEKNVLTIKLYKELYLTATAAAAEIEATSISILKTGATAGLSCPSGFALKQTYTMILL